MKMNLPSTIEYWNADHPHGKFWTQLILFDGDGHVIATVRRWGRNRGVSGSVLVEPCEDSDRWGFVVKHRKVATKKLTEGCYQQTTALGNAIAPFVRPLSSSQEIVEFQDLLKELQFSHAQIGHVIAKLYPEARKEMDAAERPFEPKVKAKPKPEEKYEEQAWGSWA